MDQFIEPCPKCRKQTQMWFERAQFQSRAIWWRGCHPCGLLAGGLTETIATHNWNREAHRTKRDMIYENEKKQPLGVRRP
jgi:hypothetical protein